ncbi:hypothetical protein [Duganella sp. HH105]|uniref:hypothetical protein n=1 Tax=Duganella sp. HH105 TaxID=1781067 RepID=UPI000877C3BD|nr:hypothetical protein [Duganella sp. HH105]OEZ57735.1 hypothetical protein DUGA6_43750 [Duganella sp. HH105]
MSIVKLVMVALLGLCSLASAQDVLLVGHVQRVILQPSGTENCPPPCPVVAPVQANGLRTVCVYNGGGCQTMEVKPDHVYRGDAAGETLQFKSRIGEWGPSFPVTEQAIVVSQEGGSVSWSFATERDGKLFIDPKRLRSIGGVPTSIGGTTELVALDDVLARLGGGR